MWIVQWERKGPEHTLLHKDDGSCWGRWLHLPRCMVGFNFCRYWNFSALIDIHISHWGSREELNKLSAYPEICSTHTVIQLGLQNCFFSLSMGQPPMSVSTFQSGHSVPGFKGEILSSKRHKSALCEWERKEGHKYFLFLPSVLHALTPRSYRWPHV